MHSVTQYLNSQRLQRARQHLAHTTWHKREGTYYFYNVDPEDTFRQISTANLHDDDVLLCGFPRSGNHWVWEILHMILNNTTDFTDRVWTPHLLESMNSDVHKTVASLPAPRVFGSHLQPRQLPEIILKKPVKVVYPIRNPKDVLASYFKVTKILAKGNCWPGDWDEFLDMHLAGEYVYGSWFEHLKAFESFMAENPQVECYVIQFEKLLEDPVKEISELCRFLGKSDACAAEIAEVTSFKNMKVGNQKKERAENERYVPNPGSMAMDAGKTRGWKSRFTVQQSETFDAAFDKLSAGCSLIERFREYLN